MLSQQKRHRLSVSVTSSNSFGLSLVQRPFRASHQGQPRRPSLTNTLSWLGRSGSAGRSQPKPDPSGQAAVKLTQGGRLGTGAVVVRTPEDALRPKNEHLPPEPVSKDMPKKFERDKQAVRYHEDDVESERDNEEDSELPSPSSSLAYTPPASPHAPLFKDISTFPIRHSSISLADSAPRPIHRQPPLSVVSALSIPLTPPASDPSNRSLPSPTQLTFTPIRVSPIPPPRVDQSDIIVSLETSTVTYRARFETLTSRPSMLATYLTMQLSQSQKEDHEEEDEPSSPFMAILEKHLKTSNANSDNDNVSPTFHIFLDRPSAPYAHILTYLRTPPAGVQTLPRAVQLRPRPHPILPDLPQLLRASCIDRERIEALIELREEALHLALDDLARLCTDELLFVSPPVPQSAYSSARDDESNLTSVHNGESDFMSVRSSYTTATSRATSRAPSVIVPLSMHVQEHSPRVNRCSSSSFQYAQAERIRDSIAIPGSIATSPLDRVLEEDDTVALQVSDTLPQWSVARDERTEDTFPLSGQPSGVLVGSQSVSNRVRFQSVEKESAPSVSQQQTRPLGDHDRIDLDAISSAVNRPPSTESNSRYPAAERKAETSKSNGPPLGSYSQHRGADTSNVTALVPEAPNMDEVLPQAERRSFSTNMLMPKERESMDAIEPMIHHVRAELRSAFEQEEEIRITSSHLSDWTVSPMEHRARAELRSQLASMEWEGITARARMSGIERRTGAQRFRNSNETKEIHAHNMQAPSQGQPQPSRLMPGPAPPGWI